MLDNVCSLPSPPLLSPPLLVQVLSHFAAVWRWTVDNHHGLFSCPDSPEDAPAVALPPSTPLHMDIHRTLLQVKMEEESLHF